MGRARRATFRATVGLLIALLAIPASAEDGDEAGRVEVPSLAHRRLEAARTMLEGAGLAVGPVYEMSWRRVLDRWGVQVPIGAVVLQSPPPTSQTGRRVRRGTRVALLLSAVADGQLPANLPPPSPKARGELGTPQRARNDGRDTPAAPDAPSDPPADPPADVPAAHAPAADDPSPSGRDDAAAPDTPEAPGPSAEAPASLEDDEPTDPDVATGSPEAPKPAPPADRRIVPPLLGLDLSVAEQLARDAEMTLYVERVAGHPVGHVLRQAPEPYEPRPPGGVVKVTVTAGGDFEGPQPPAPDVYVTEREVPSLLDRTQAQAERILRDVGLRPEVVVAARGVPGRVVDQEPAAGARVPAGGVVTVRVGPPDAAANPATPPPAPEAGPGDGSVADAPASGSLPATSVPTPIAPAAGTAMPREARLPVGFTWRRVEAAQAYVLEVQEETAPGTWIPLLQRPVRSTAAVLEIERLDPGAAGRLRWRVRAVLGGRPGPACPWVDLK